MYNRLWQPRAVYPHQDLAVEAHPVPQQCQAGVKDCVMGLPHAKRFLAHPEGFVAYPKGYLNGFVAYPKGYLKGSLAHPKGLLPHPKAFLAAHKESTACPLDEGLWGMKSLLGVKDHPRAVTRLH